MTYRDVHFSSLLLIRVFKVLLVSLVVDLGIELFLEGTWLLEMRENGGKNTAWGVTYLISEGSSGSAGCSSGWRGGRGMPMMAGAGRFS